MWNIKNNTKKRNLPLKLNCVTRLDIFCLETVTPITQRSEILTSVPGPQLVLSSHFIYLAFLKKSIKPGLHKHPLKALIIGIRNSWTILYKITTEPAFLNSFFRRQNLYFIFQIDCANWIISKSFFDYECFIHLNFLTAIGLQRAALHLGMGPLFKTKIIWNNFKWNTLTKWKTRPSSMKWEFPLFVCFKVYVYSNILLW